MTTNDHSADSLPDNAIAVIGMAGRFPGADSVSEFWDNLREGRESIVTLSEEDLLAEGVSAKALANHAYVRRAGLMRGIDEFDAEFFGFTPQAARTMDPQHRLFLQEANHALEDAGYTPPKIDASVGVFATSTTSGYLLHNLMSHYDPEAIIGERRRIGARGAIDHFGIAVDDLATLEAVRDRLVAAGADIGEIQKLGGEWSLFFRDVDGMELEVCAPS